MSEFGEVSEGGAESRNEWTRLIVRETAYSVQWVVVSWFKA